MLVVRFDCIDPSQTPNVHSKESLHMFKSTGVLTGLPKKHVCLRRLHQQAWVYTLGGNLKKLTTQSQFPKVQGQILPLQYKVAEKEGWIPSEDGELADLFTLTDNCPTLNKDPLQLRYKVHGPYNSRYPFLSQIFLAIPSEITSDSWRTRFTTQIILQLLILSHKNIL